MRENKFRGKRLDNGEWIYGGIIFIDGGKPHIFCNHGAIEVDPTTVGQFSEALDNDGKEIYEGDIIGGSNGSVNGYKYTFKREIKWRDAACGFNTPNWGYMDSTHYFEVIGNIHDNPELLKTE